MLSSAECALSSPAVVETAKAVVATIIDTYFAPNTTFLDLHKLMSSSHLIDPLRAFSERCRDDLSNPPSPLTVGLTKRAMK